MRYLVDHIKQFLDMIMPIIELRYLFLRASLRDISIATYIIPHRKWWNACEIQSSWNIIHRHNFINFSTTLESYYMNILLSISNLIWGGTTFCLDQCLNSAWHTFNDMILPMVPKVIPQTDNCTLRLFHRYNMTKFLWDLMLHVHPNVLNGIQIREIWGVLKAHHFQFQSDWNTNLFVDKSIVFYDNWLSQILKWLFPKLLKRSSKDLVSINSRVDFLSICQLKKQSRSHLIPSERPSEYHSSTSIMFFTICATWNRPLAILHLKTHFFEP